MFSIFLFLFFFFGFRFTGLIDSGAVVYELRPLWYDVYKRFPPKVEPLAIRPEPKVSVKPIFYQEDILRAYALTFFRFLYYFFCFFKGNFIAFMEMEILFTISLHQHKN